MKVYGSSFFFIHTMPTITGRHCTAIMFNLKPKYLSGHCITAPADIKTIAYEKKTFDILIKFHLLTINNQTIKRKFNYVMSSNKQTDCSAYQT